MKKKYNLLISAVLMLSTLLPTLALAGYSPGPLDFDPNNNVERNTMLGNATPTTVAARIINWVLGLLAIIAVSLIIFAGFIWMFATGNEEKVGNAKEILKGALLGLITILSSYGVSNYFFEHLINATTK